MAPKGLPSVEAKFTADNSGYILAIKEMIEQNKLLIKSIGEVNAQIKTLGKSLADLHDKTVTITVKYVTVGNMPDPGDITRTIRYVTEGNVSDVVGADSLSKINAVSDAMNKARDNGAVWLTSLNDLKNQLKDAAAAADAHAEAQRKVTLAQIESTYGAKDLAQAQEGIVKNAYSIGKAYNEAEDAIRSFNAQQAVGYALANAISGGDRGGAGLAAAGFGVGGGIGGWLAGRGVTSVAGGRGAGGFDFPAGTAGYDAAAILGFAARVGPAVHYVTMAIAELAATAIPAAVALGAAGVVGYQGAEQLAGRAQAIYTVGEGLGYPAYGISAGQMIAGPRGGAIQQYQNIAGGGVSVLAGAGINLATGPGTGGFLNSGVQTLAMIDRGVAAFQNNFGGPSGTGAKLATALGGGTDFLRAFGDVAGNVGGTLLNVAGNLPGVGQAWLYGLKGLTGAIRAVTGFGPAGPLIGAGLAAEAGYRLGRPALGLAGRAMTGLGGLAEKLGLGEVPAALSAEDIAAGLTAESGTGLAGLLSGAGLGALGASALPTAGLATSAFLLSKLVSSMPSGTARRIAGMQAGLYGQGFTSQFAPLSMAIGKATGLAAPPATAGAMMQQVLASGATGAEIGRFGYTTAADIAGGTPSQLWGQASSRWGQTMGDFIKSGPTLVSLLKDAGFQGVTMAQAFQVGQNALLNLGTAFKSTGQLTDVAKTAVKDYLTTLGATTGLNMAAMSGGTIPGLMAGIGAVNIMNSPQMQSLAKINQAADSMTQIMTGGPLGAAAAFGVRGAMAAAVGGVVNAPTAAQAAAGAVAAPATTAQQAQALSGFFSPANAAAWSAFTGSANTPGIISTMQQNMDQIKTYESLKTIGTGQGAGLAAFYVQQNLGLGARSAAANAMLEQQAIFGGVPGISVGMGREAFVKAINKAADTAGAATSTMNQAVINSAKVSQVAQQFSGQMTPALATQAATQAAQDALKFGTGGPGSAAALKDYVGLQKLMGNTTAAGIEATLGGLNISPHVMKSIDSQISTMTATIRAKVIATQPTLKNLTEHIHGVLDQVPTPKVKPATYQVVPHVVPAVIPKIPDQTFNIWGIVKIIGGAGPATGTPVGSGGHFFVGGQSGFRVPGYGGGDIVPAMLEPGEAVVPKHLVSSLAPFLSANKVPGFAGGMLPVSGSLGPSLFQAESANAINNLAITVNALSQAILSGGFSTPVAKIFSGYAKSQQDTNMWGQFAREIMLGMIQGIRNAPGETKAMANALVEKVKQEVALGQNIAAAAKQGGGYNPWGGGSTLLSTFGGLATPQTTAQGQPYQYYIDQTAAAGGAAAPLSVQQQMGDYLQAMKSFQGDLGKLSKAGLNKNLLGQLLAAGPLAGDQEAQSILSGAGGVKGANSLWNQINATANKLGVSGAGAFYGNAAGGGKQVGIGVNASAAPVHQLQAAINALHGKTVTLHVDVSVSGGGGGGGGGHLSAGQAKAVGQAVQSHLLIQAKNNRHTGIMLPGYGG